MRTMTEAGERERERHTFLHEVGRLPITPKLAPSNISLPFAEYIKTHGQWQNQRRWSVPEAIRHADKPDGILENMPTLHDH